MKIFMYSMLVFFILVVPGCVNIGGKTNPPAVPAATADFSGTYQGPDGTLVIKKVPDAHFVESLDQDQWWQSATVMSKMQIAKKNNYSDTGKIAPNAYLITTKFKYCPISINHIALPDGHGGLLAADVDGPAYRINALANGSLEVDFPMATIRGYEGAGGECMSIAPFVKMAK